ncbi:hypothetical protein QA640_44685 (plasmid) [Bradyrhizobium sp. CB82]|uniref:hypothetical protein n=1 Tax=Bradyrhizobium sp. CB82 TaxID=3039159 RepID=UPI0024B25FFB|nr:hypothetical protein [Bradyrhizobium sp. CB82]WFU45907.1 hypothetical protein QA640_44685 [Bradyrhizobium sp. CB82]
MHGLIGTTRFSFPARAHRKMLAASLGLGLFLTSVCCAGVLSESDFRQAESLRPLFANLMNDLVATAKRPDVSSGDADCVNSTIRELLQISDELVSYEYLITMEKDLTDFGDKNPMRDIVKFAVDKSSTILISERRRLVQISERCTKYPLGQGKIEQAVTIIDTTTGILASIRARL